jgi:clan AA aspartic protease (TIGR02281 family)
MRKTAIGVALAALLVSTGANAQVFFNTPFGTFGIGPLRQPSIRVAPRPVPLVGPAEDFQSDADIICGPPRMLYNLDQSPDTDPVVSVEVSYNPKDHAWRVFHHLRSGGVVSRTDQYAAVDTSDGGRTQWTGTLNRNRSLYMVGEVKFDRQNHPLYNEWLYNRGQGNRLEMNLVAKCEWNRVQNEDRQSSAGKGDREETRVKTIPYNANLTPKEDSVPIYPGANGNSALIDVVVGGQPVRMLLDTGATHISVTQDLARRIVAQGQGSWGGTAQVKLADGSVISERIINIETVMIGSHTVHSVQGSVTADGGLMLLPFPLLNSIAPFKIDTRNRKLLFDGQEAVR